MGSALPAPWLRLPPPPSRSNLPKEIAEGFWLPRLAPVGLGASRRRSRSRSAVVPAAASGGAATHAGEAVRASLATDGPWSPAEVLGFLVSRERLAF